MSYDSKKDPFNKRSLNTANAVSPLNKDQLNVGIENISVKLIDYPDELRMKKTLSKMVKATIGSDPAEEIPDEVGEELFKGGLQTGLESFMVVFEVSGVDRTITHQLVRTSKAKFHQQSSRFTYMGDKFNIRMPETIAADPIIRKLYEDLAEMSRMFYQMAVLNDIPYQDARYGCLEGTETYIICEYPLGVFINTYSYRACEMFQWGINGVFKMMKAELIKQIPWLEPYIKISCEKGKRCTFQGWESTEHCSLPWKNDRIFKSKIFSSDNKLFQYLDVDGNEIKDKSIVCCVWDGYKPYKVDLSEVDFSNSETQELGNGIKITSMLDSNVFVFTRKECSERLKVIK